jgi:hypothetical protein
MTDDKTSGKVQNPDKVKIVANVPALFADGQGLAVNNENGATNIMFLQVTNINPETKEKEASVVANVRLDFNQLKGLWDSIGQAITDFENSKKV